jgi:tRNA-Thr(GGU) m(6)t(6)A37 methyltransferase TsaA
MRWCLTTVVVLALVVGEVTEPMAQEYVLRPVGMVVKRDGKSVLDIRPAYRDALLGLEGFSHVVVLYWLDRNDRPEKRSILKVHPRADPRNPVTGVFATRSPVRPNLIGFSVCKIRSVQGCRVLVDRIDAFDRTPIVDLKPYIPGSDCVPTATVPDWVGTGKRR